MADGNATITSALHGPALSFGEDFYIAMSMSRSDVDADLLTEVAARLSRCAEATLHVARLRGENDNDLPGTLDGALGAAEICVQLSNGFNAAARQLEKERSHGGR